MSFERGLEVVLDKRSCELQPRQTRSAPVVKYTVEIEPLSC
jgi:hypothetical protein